MSSINTKILEPQCYKHLIRVPYPAIKNTNGFLDSKITSIVKPKHIPEKDGCYPSEDDTTPQSQLENSKKS